jgi:hypothetical protein
VGRLRSLVAKQGKRDVGEESDARVRGWDAGLIGR